MNYYIVLDGGTTNTRLYLVRRQMLDEEKLPIGSGKAENLEPLRQAIRQGIRALLERNSLKEEQIRCVLASGNITSELGLCLVPHISVPAGIAQLHESMHHARFPELTAIPFVFIPGVKVSGQELLLTDMMRGEETELFGLLDEPEPRCLYVLPGSHNKLVSVDGEGRICGIRTMLTGELLAAISRHTILKAAVELQGGQLCREKLLQGWEYCEKLGMNEALFKVRVMKNLFGEAADAVYSFFVGIVLHDDVRTVLSCDADKIVIGGQSKMQEALALLLRSKTKIPVICANQQQIRQSVIRGALRIFEYGGNQE